MSNWEAVAQYLASFANFYPTISAWSDRVRAGIPMRKRSVIALLSEFGDVQGLAITKHGSNAKLCHFSVTEPARGVGLGAMLMWAAALDMQRAGARRVHVTTGEEATEEFGAFFARCGFARETYQNNRYRRGCSEWEWATDLQVLIDRVASSECKAMRSSNTTRGERPGWTWPDVLAGRMPFCERAFVHPLETQQREWSVWSGEIQILTGKAAAREIVLEGHDHLEWPNIQTEGRSSNVRAMRSSVGVPRLVRLCPLKGEQLGWQPLFNSD